MNARTLPAFSLKCFGTGDGWPSADRDHSSYLYQLGSACVMVDCGDSISRKYKAAGLKYDLIDRIVVTHLHFDHVGGLFMLLQGFWLEKRRKPLVIHLPADGIEPIRQLLKAGCLFPELLGFPLEWAPLHHRQAFKVQQAQVTPIANTHLHGLRRVFRDRYPMGYEAFSLLLEGEGLRVGHTSDIGSVEDVKLLCEEPLDLLVCELAHAELEELCRLLRERPVKQILFVHLSRPYWKDFERTRQRAAQLLPDRPFAFAHDNYELAW